MRRCSCLILLVACVGAAACGKERAAPPGVQVAEITEAPDPGGEVSADVPPADDASPTAVAPAGPGQGCKVWGQPAPRGTLQDEDLAEVSGLVASARHEGVFWMHNDGGNKPRIYAVDPTGKRVATYKLKGVPDEDWEDIALAPCSAEPILADTSCIYVGDTGDNLYKRSVYHVLRLPEPKLPKPGKDDSREVDSDKVEVFSYAYPDGPQDVEAMAVLPDTRVILLTKQDDGLSKVYRLALQGGQVGQAEYLGTLEVRDPPLIKGLSLRVTAADLGNDGRSLLVRSYFRIFLFDVGAALTGPAAKVAPVLAAAKPTLLQGAFETQGEAIAWDRKAGFWHVAEGAGATLFYVGCAQ